MSNSSYYDYIYKVDGETIKIKPRKIFESAGVYLIVDKELKLIWIWAGSHSRLFHRYMAANWAGKLKTKKKFYNFKYEVIKQGIEPSEFHVIHSEIKERRDDLAYPGQSRQNMITDGISHPNIIPTSTKIVLQEISQSEIKLSKSVKSRIQKLISEVKEIQMHIKYSIGHIDQRFAEIEKLLEK
ncbi:MAG: hypothetical protein ACW99L_03155 [Promethearchaeota archaeon]|jgi:hypothetical protein